MKKWLRNLQNGDKVYWTDPDNDLCSRTLTISTIEWVGEVGRITDINGDYLEVFSHELRSGSPVFSPKK